jgi:F-type H+-transporting ATPase subunit delta
VSDSRSGSASTSSAGADPVVHGYATAILAVAKAEGALERVEDELYTFARAVEVNPELRDRLAAPGVDTGAKLGIVTDLLGGRAHPQTVSAVAYIVQAGRARQLSAIAETLAEMGAASRAHSFAEVRSAVALDAEQQRKLRDGLSRAAGRPIDLKVVVDPNVVGGVVAKIGDTVIDGSVARRLSELRTALTGA